MQDDGKKTPDNPLEALTEALSTALIALVKAVSDAAAAIAAVRFTPPSVETPQATTPTSQAQSQSTPAAVPAAGPQAVPPIPPVAAPVVPQTPNQSAPVPPQKKDEQPDLGAVVATLTAALTALTEVVSAAAAAAGGVAPNLTAFSGATGKVGGSLSSLGGVVSAAGSAVRGLVGSVSSAGGIFQSAGGAISGVSSMLSGVLGPAGAAVGKALGEAVSKVGEFINAVKPFVEALAPGTILLFNQALENLQATVGVAFEPIFQVLTGVFQRIGGLILPVMQALRPVIEQVSKAFASLILPIVNLLVGAFQGLMPFIANVGQFFANLVAQLQPFIAIFSLINTLLQPFKEAFALLAAPALLLGELMGVLAMGIGEAVDAVNIVFKTLYETIKSLLPSFNIKGLFDGLAKSITSVIGQFLILVGTLAKFFGADKFLATLINNLSPKSGEVAAPKNASIGSVESVAKDIATAAATASGQADTDKEQSFADVVKALEKIKSGGESQFTVLIGKLDALIKLLTPGSALGYDSTTDAAADVTGALSMNPFAFARLGRHIANRNK